MSDAPLSIRKLKSEDFEEVLKFSDQHIGQNYFSSVKLQKIFEMSQKDGVIYSYVLLKDETIKGIRLTYPHGQWIEKLEGLMIHPHLWGVSKSEVAYFQSLFLSPDATGQGWGKKLSLAAIEALKAAGSKAVVCHSWNESPHNSSRRYLDSLGFQPLIEIPKFWNSVDYECVLCGKPCMCTATEMVLYL